MERLPEDPILKYNPDGLWEVRRELNFDNLERINEAIDILDDWTKKQTHFIKKEYPRDYLERTIITTKGSVERAKTRLDKLCTFKTLMPNFFSITDIREVKRLNDFIIHGHLPKPTKDNYRMYFLKCVSTEFNSSLMFDYYRAVIILSEYMRMRDYVNGFIVVFDYRDINLMGFLTKLNPIELRQMMILLMEAYGMRIKAIHILSSSKMIDNLISLMRQILSDKVAGRIHVHKELEELHAYLPKNLLPLEYGGDEKPLKKIQNDWINAVTTKESIEYITEICKAGTNESCRQSDKFNEQYVGMPGSFRTLSVD